MVGNPELASPDTMKTTVTFCLLSALPLTALEFEAPVRLKAGDEFIDTEVGHAAPFVGDIDGDGVRDLLVGQFGDGKLWIFRNEGSDVKPVLAEGRVFQDGEPHGTVPSG